MDIAVHDNHSETTLNQDATTRSSPQISASSVTSLELSTLMVDEHEASVAEYLSFPSLTASKDDGVSNKDVLQLDLDLPKGRSSSFDQNINDLESLICAAWALLSGRTIGNEKIGFDVRHSGQGNVDSAFPHSLLVNCQHEQSVEQFILAVEAHLAAPTFQCRTGKAGSRFRTLLSIDKGDQCATSPNVDEDYSLIMDMRSSPTELRVVARFDSTALEPWLVQRLMRTLENCIQLLHHTREISDGPLLQDLDIVSPFDLEQIWNWSGDLPLPTERCMHHIIQEQVHARPSSIAIDSWDGQLSYSELDRLSSLLADHLLDLGVQGETFIPLCFEKSMWMPVSMLAVLKTGAAFCLLEPSLPDQRLQTIIEEVDAKLVLSSPANMPTVSRLLDRVLQVDLASIESSGSLRHRHDNSSQSPESAMFAVFTSGSTGKPKGAVLTHTNYASAFTHQLGLMGFSKDSRVFDFASYAFDVSIHNVFSTLTTGACLCIPSDSDRRNNIAGAMAAMRVTLAHLTPSVARLIEPKDVPSLQTMIFTGEPLPVDEAARWWSQVHVVNEYGPAECTINTVNHKPSSAESATEIGRTAGVSGWVVDPENHDRLVAIGSVGELLVEGPLVGRGYINDVVKTASTFIHDPAWLLKGGPRHAGRRGRLYKTGDLVRYSESGSLRIVGRKDMQVKIRGQRVDLGDVEHWTKSCLPHVENVVAEMIIPQGCEPIPTLVAFVQSVNEPASSDTREARIVPLSQELQHQLALQLPSYTLPAVLLYMEALPLSPTGKLNRKRLREIGASLSAEEIADARRGSGSTKRQPSSEIELRLRDLWARALIVPKDNIGLDDNFLRLGGNSITSMKFVSEARKLGIEVTVADTFQQPTLEALAQRCHQLLDSDIPDITPFSLLRDDGPLIQEIADQISWDSSKIQDAYPCTRLQEGLMFLTSKRPGDYLEQSVLQLSPDVCLTQLKRAWDTVVTAEPILRTRLIQHNDTGLFQVVLAEDAQWIEVNGLDEYLALDRKRSMGLGDALSRFALVRDYHGVARWLVWTQHHSIYDGWSIRLVAEAVVRAYLGEAVRPGTNFNRFIKYVEEQDGQQAADYWIQYFRGFDSRSLVPPGHQPVADSVVKHSIPNVTGNKRDVITISLLIRAAWALVVGQLSSLNDVVFGTTLYGRNAAVTGLDEMVGPTIATVPIRVQFTSSQTVSDYLGTVQREAVEMMPYEQTGLQKIATLSTEAQRACQLETHLVIQPEDETHGKSILGQWKSGEQEQWFSTYALTLEIWLGAEGISASAMFDSRLIPSWTARNLLCRLEHVMSQLDHACPGQMLSEIEITTADDLEQIWTWNDHVPEQVARSIPDLLTERIRLQPDTPAICAWDGDLTYRQLDELATKLARHLNTTCGVTPGVNALVPLCFEKSIWTTVAMCGVLKANAGFVLLDPKLPERRLQDIIQQCQSGLVVSGVRQAGLAEGLINNVLTLGWDFFSMLVVDDSIPLSPIDPSSIAYVVFTSGSTGIPKGVMISHANATSAQHYQCELMGHSSGSRLLDFASYSFDVAISNVFSMLACGGCLCVPSEDDRANHPEDAIVKLGVNALDLTPSVIQLLSPERLSQVKLLTLGGEPLRPSDLQGWYGRVRICNAYGPSECTPTCTINCDIKSQETASQIGRGTGAVTWIVNPDDHNDLLAPGCIGELLLEGPIVGLGYLNDPIRTDIAFVEDPEWLLQGSPSSHGRRGRLYKTGDLVRYQQDGKLVFVGRKDAQVKIRGQRVEPSEIEAVLFEHKMVNDAAVVVQKQENAADSWLAGFVTIRHNHELQTNNQNAQRPELLDDKVRSWETQFNDTYSTIDTTRPELIGRDFVGWTSMYDGKEIDKNDMAEWLTDTIDTIMNGRTIETVLEIGSGSGMILFNLARYGFQQYIGIEPSAPAVGFSTKAARIFPDMDGKVHILKGTAEDVSKLQSITTSLDKPIAPNMVVVNSVIQYFPSQAYLLSVIQDLLALGTVETIFFGDVRSFALHQEFLAERTLHIAGKGVSKHEFKNVLENLEKVEPELLVDPAFFTGLIDRVPEIQHVEILPKKMAATNELSAYRYAAVLHAGKPQKVKYPDTDKWVDFSSRELNDSTLVELLTRDPDQQTLAVSGIPNSKTAYASEIVAALQNAETCNNWLDHAKQASQNTPSWSAKDINEIAQRAGFRVEISWARQHATKGGFDAIFYKAGITSNERTIFRFPTDHENRLLESLTSNPIHQEEETGLPEQLQKMLQDRLPSYMVPRNITILDEMPVTNNGKVNRSSLSTMIGQKSATSLEKRPPSTKAEKKLQAVWAKVLNMKTDDIGVDDDFIQLGGTSLDAMKVVKLAGDVGIKLEVSDMFRHSTTSISRLLESTTIPQADTAERLLTAISRYDKQIAPSQIPSTPFVPPSPDRRLTVLLTGANGFVGTQILRHLLEHGRISRVIALVRGKTDGIALQRVVDAATSMKWWSPIYATALEVWRGDLAAPHLGLTDTRWRMLETGGVDVVIHNGAAVHFMKTYDVLEAANVGSTVQMLEVAGKVAGMKVVYVSSARHGEPGEEEEKEVARGLAAHPNGYNETKFVSESLVRRAAGRNPGKFGVVSPGLVVGTPTEGVANMTDWVWKMVAACVRVGMYNADEAEQWIPIADAGAVATTVLDAALGSTAPVVSQVKGGMKMQEFWDAFQTAGYDLHPAKAEEWMTAIREDIQKHPDSHPLGALSEMLDELTDTTREKWAESWHHNSSFSPIRLKVALTKNVGFLQKSGFLPAVGGVSSSIPN